MIEHNLTIETERLRLVAASPEMLTADLENRALLPGLLDAIVPNNWPPETLRDALGFFRDKVTAEPAMAGFWFWYWLRRESPGTSLTLIGSGGFKGGPDVTGTVEIGYSVLPQFHRHGFATEGAGGLIRWAWEDQRVVRIFGDALEDNLASRKTLHKLGFTKAGPGAERSTLRFELIRPK